MAHTCGFESNVSKLATFFFYFQNFHASTLKADMEETFVLMKTLMLLLRPLFKTSVPFDLGGG